MDPSDRPKASQGAPIDELTVLDETIGRLRSRMATGDDSERPGFDRRGDKTTRACTKALTSALAIWQSAPIHAGP